MSSLAGSLAGLFVAGMVGGYAGLCLLAPTDETQTAMAAARVADPPAMPCSMQAWPNADRKCLDWTSPRADSTEAKAEAKADGAQKPAAGAAPSTVGMNTSGAGRQGLVPAPQAAAASGDMAAAPEPQAAPEVTTKAPAAKARTTTHTRSRALAAVPSNAYAFDGSARRSRERSFFDTRPHGLWW